MKAQTRFPRMMIIGVVLLLLLVPVTWVSAGTGSMPSYGRAVVDCNPDTPISPPPEWDLTNDFFANMCRAFDCVNKPLESKLYLRYQCVYPLPEPPAIPDVIVYALVKAEDGVPIIVNGTVGGTTYDPSFAYIKLLPPNTPRVSGLNDNSCTATGNPPEFAWINKHNTIIGGNTVTVADGWEASFKIPAGVYPASKDTGLWVHTQVYDAGAQTSGLDNKTIPLDVSYCPPPPTAVTLASFSATPAGKGIRLDWETASELDNLGFNLYRAASADGPRTKLNADLIPSQAFGSPLGVAYQFVDATAKPGITYSYWLEDVDVHGASAYHGPVSATVPALRRLLPTRPRLAPMPPIRHK